MSAISINPVGAPNAGPVAARGSDSMKNKALVLARKYPLGATAGGLLTGGVGGMLAGGAAAMYASQDPHYFGKHCIDAIQPGNPKSAEEIMSGKKTGYIQTCKDLYNRKAYASLKTSKDSEIRKKLEAARDRVCDDGEEQKKWREFCEEMRR